MELSFKIEGSYIMDLARRKAHDEHNIPSALKLLMDCLMTDQLTKDERLLLALQILNKKAYIKGVYPEDSYGVIVEDTSKTDIQAELNILLQPITKHIKDTLNDYKNLEQKYVFLLEYLDLSEHRRKEIDDAYYEEYDEHMFKIKNEVPPILQSYLDRQHMDTDDDYGWLEPDGTYHPVEWGDHQEWAVKYLDKHYPFKKHTDMYWTSKEKRQHIVGGDVLIYKLHWILIHNPSQGLGTPTYDATFGMTKKQKEFLYDYYIKRNQHRKANELYQKDDT